MILLNIQTRCDVQKNMGVLQMSTCSKSPSDSPKDLPDVCTKGSGAYAANFAESFGMAAIGMCGLSGLFGDGPTPLDKLKEQIKEEQQKTQSLINASSYAFAKAQEAIDGLIYQGLVIEAKAATADIKYVEEILNEKITTNSIYIAATFGMIIIIISYLLLKKKCC